MYLPFQIPENSYIGSFLWFELFFFNYLLYLEKEKGSLLQTFGIKNSTQDRVMTKISGLMEGDCLLLSKIVESSLSHSLLY